MSLRIFIQFNSVRFYSFRFIIIILGSQINLAICHHKRNLASKQHIRFDRFMKCPLKVFGEFFSNRGFKSKIMNWMCSNSITINQICWSAN